MPESDIHVLWLDPGWRVVARAEGVFPADDVISRTYAMSSLGPFLAARYHWFDLRLRRSGTAPCLADIPDGTRHYLDLRKYYPP